MASLRYEKETINKLMTVVDNNQDQLSEGDYIKICNAIKLLHDNSCKPFPLHSITEYLNKDAVESCKDSIHFERNNLKYLEEMVHSTKDEIADIEKEIKHVTLHNKNPKKNKYKLKSLNSQLFLLKENITVYHKKIADCNKKIATISNKMAYYRQLKADDVCEQFNSTTQQYVDEEIDTLAQRYTHDANISLINAFSKVYTRINSLDWLDDFWTNDAIRGALMDFQHEISELKTMFNDQVDGLSVRNSSLNNNEVYLYHEVVSSMSLQGWNYLITNESYE